MHDCSFVTIDSPELTKDLNSSRRIDTPDYFDPNFLKYALRTETLRRWAILTLARTADMILNKGQKPNKV